MLQQIRRLLPVLAMLGLFTGCANLQPQSYAAARDLSGQVELADVPFFPQNAYQCGPAVLATVLTYEGVPRQPEELLDEVYLPARRGSLQVELLAASRRAGLVPYLLTPDLNALFHELSAGNPVIVLQNQRFDFWPEWHYAVAVGYSLERDEMILRSSTAKRLLLSIDAFDRSWRGGGRWAFVALPPTRLPATAAEARYVEAAVALEAVSPDAAAAAYRTALIRWPHNLVARMGLGNIAYHMGHYADAESQFQRASQDHPGAGDAWNNLAQVLAEEGRLSEALEAAQRAVAIGGARQTIYQSTVKEIQQRRTPSSR